MLYDDKLIDSFSRSPKLPHKLSKHKGIKKRNINKK